MPPKGSKRKDSGGGSGAKKAKKGAGDQALPSIAPDALAMSHMREFEKWFLESSNKSNSIAQSFY